MHSILGPVSARTASPAFPALSPSAEQRRVAGHTGERKRQHAQTAEGRVEAQRERSDPLDDPTAPHARPPLEEPAQRAREQRERLAVRHRRGQVGRVVEDDH